MSSTRAGQILGTAAYMSPEQAEGKKLDYRSDIFSFGAVLYELAGGKRAFPGDSHASVMAAILRDEPRPLSELRGDMPWELDQLITLLPAERTLTGESPDYGGLEGDAGGSSPTPLQGRPRHRQDASLLSRRLSQLQYPDRCLRLFRPLLRPFSCPRQIR